MKQSKEEIEKHKYLYETEGLVHKIIEEFINSPLDDYERARQYIIHMKELRKKYFDYVFSEKDFKNSERHKKVLDFVSIVPQFDEYMPSSSHGEYLNKMFEKTYYERIAEQLKIDYGIEKEKKHLSY